MSEITGIRALASALIERGNWLRTAGITFGGKRDVYEALGYTRAIELRQYRERYERNEVAARIIDAYAFATWRKGAEIFEDENPEVETKFEKAWAELDKRLNLWTTFRRADQLAGLGRYAIILLGAPGNLDQPLEKLTPDQLMYINAFSEEDATINTLELDITNPRFGLPTSYLIRRLTPTILTQASLASRNVHWSRVIHVCDGNLDDAVYGQPRLQRIWNRLDDLEKVAGGGAEAFWKRADQGMQLDIDPNVKFNTDDLERLKDEVEEYVHGLKRIVRTKGVTMNTLGSDVANFESPVNAIIALISTGTGIPQRILMGSERGELASTQDKTNWDERVQDRRTDFAEPTVRKLVDRFIDLGVLPEPKEYFVGWPEERNLNELQRADLATRWASLNQAVGETVVLPSEIRDTALGLPPFTEEQLAEIEKKEAEAQAAAQAQADAAAAAAVPGDPAALDPDADAAAEAIMAGQDPTAEEAEEEEEEKPKPPIDKKALKDAIANRDVAAIRALIGKVA